MHNSLVFADKVGRDLYINWAWNIIKQCESNIDNIKNFNRKFVVWKNGIVFNYGNFL